MIPTPFSGGRDAEKTLGVRGRLGSMSSTKGSTAWGLGRKGCIDVEYRGHAYMVAAAEWEYRYQPYPRSPVL